MIPAHIDPTVDIIEVEVFRKALVSLTEEMAITLKRASGSSIVVDSHDFSTAIFDAAGEQLAFSGWVTMHCASSRIGVLATIELFRRDPELAPGDAIIVNDPYTSGALHQADVGIVMPLFDGGALVGWCFSNVHVLDIGGSAIGGLATTAHDVWEEALRFPPTKIAPAASWTLSGSCSSRARFACPTPVINDLRGMIAAGNTAQRKIDELMIRYGADRFRLLSEAAKELSEVALREKVAQLPDGVYEAQEWIEYDGHEAEELPNMRCRLTISGDNLTVAMAGDPQIDAPVVGTPPAVIGCLMSAMLCMLTYDIPMNEGIWRHVEFDLGPKGTIVNALPPAPVSLSHVGSGFRAGRAFNDVLAQVCSLTDSPELRARVAGAPQNAVPCSIFFGQNQFGRATVSVLLSTAIGVGGGAQSLGDGLDCYGAQCMQGTRMPDVEVFETQEPMLVLYRRLSTDSGGPGACRGGLGMTEATVLWSTDQMRGIAQSHCERIPPRGFAGGFPGGTGKVSVIRGSDVRAQLAAGVFPTLDPSIAETWPSICAAVIDRDDVVISYGGGGGGLGDPLRRDPACVALDVGDARISSATALNVYGVVLTRANEADHEATRVERLALRRKRLADSALESDLVPIDEESDPSVSVAIVGTGEHANWSCVACGHLLGVIEGNWRTSGVLVEERLAADALARRNQLIRPRTGGRAVVLREIVCPKCASMLSVDVALAGDPLDIACQGPAVTHMRA